MMHKKFVAMFIALTIALTLLPISSNAQKNAEPMHESGEALSTNMVHEVTELREENIKHYALPDGSFRAVAYNQPIHQKDSNGNWKTIDNSLRLQTKAGNSTYTTVDNRVAFPKIYEPNKPILSLQADDCNISVTLLSNQLTTSTAMSLLPATVHPARVSSEQTCFSTIDDAINTDYSESIIYKNVLNNTDLEYIIDGGTVKENIIVNSQSSTYVYAFALTLNNLYAKMEADGSIGIYDSTQNKLRYAIPAPYMYDANNNMSSDVSYQLTGESGKYFLTITANESWINDENRAFPVTIDPTFTYATEQVQDSYIDSDYPDTIRYLSPLLWVRSNRTSYIKTPNLTLPEGAVVISAQLQAWYYYFDNITSGYVDVGVYQINQDWSGQTLTWNNMSNYPNRGLDTTQLDKQRASVGGATETTPKRLIFDITAAVRNWADGEPNYGVALRYEVSPNLSVLFKSYESSSSYKPRIVYSYRIADTHYKITNYYDSTFEGIRANLILPTINAVSLAYYTQLGISFEMSGSATRRYDLVDACSLGPNSPCTLACTDGHHKDVSQIAYSLLEEERDDNEKTVYWTDHRTQIYCQHDDAGNCFAKHPLGLTVHSSPVIHILKLSDSAQESTELQACMFYLLAHEMAHSLGLGEPNLSPSHEESLELCVMKVPPGDASDVFDLVENFKSSETLFCESCSAELNSILAN